MQGYYGTDVSAAEAKSISSAPRALTSSCWNLSSEATFLRKRRNRVSMSGDWPRTGVYISAIVEEKSQPKQSS